jgi:hypothetical protein
MIQKNTCMRGGVAVVERSLGGDVEYLHDWVTRPAFLRVR